MKTTAGVSLRNVYAELIREVFPDPSCTIIYLSPEVLALGKTTVAKVAGEIMRQQKLLGTEYKTFIGSFLNRAAYEPPILWRVSWDDQFGDFDPDDGNWCFVEVVLGPFLAYPPRPALPYRK